MCKEIWKNVPEFNGMVQASTLGRIKSFYRYKYGKILQRIEVDCFGYTRVTIKGKHYKIHRLVAQAFIPNPENKREVNHKDGNKLNNKVDNLEWATRSENQKHAYELGLQKPSEKQKQATSRWNKENRIKTVYQYNLDGELIKIHKSCYDCSIELNTSDATVSRHCHSGKPLKGYIMKY